MPVVSAKPLPDAITHREARTRGLVVFLSMAICRKDDTFLRLTKGRQCVACLDREAPRLLALKAQAQAARKVAAAKARKVAAEAARKVADQAERHAAREATKKATALAQRRATRAANRVTAAAAQVDPREGTQEAAGGPIAGAGLLPPWFEAEGLAASATVAGVPGAKVAQVVAVLRAPWEEEDDDEAPPW